MNYKDQSLSISNPQNIPFGVFGKLGIVSIILGMLGLICSFFNLIMVSKKNHIKCYNNFDSYRNHLI